MIEKIVMATNNANKLREVREILSPLGIDVISQKEAGADVEPEENGMTFEENALIKSKAVYDIVGVPVIADDSGLCVDALYGRPSVYSARYAPKGQECEKLLDEMKDVPENDRTAYFECCIALVTEDEEPQFMTGRCYGKISTEARGTNGFGYDPVFLYGERTLAEMMSEEKNKISHRAKALEKLCDYLKKRNGE
ncbi:MAG: RdgB/HAM1 family non-canonical purine NTP pyrophosphatase [Ruminococcus sp.]|nr:RdgB/HAM1 family non-canonical purine NTP pyrophosphatase [Ruminococcus sp.]